MGLFLVGGISFAHAQTPPEETEETAEQVEQSVLVESVFDEGLGEAERAPQSRADESLQENSCEGCLLEDKKKALQHQIVLLSDTFWLLVDRPALPVSFRYHLPFKHWAGLELGADFVFFLDKNKLFKERLLFFPVELFLVWRFIPSLATYWKFGMGFLFMHFSDSGGYRFPWFLPLPLPVFQWGLLWNLSQRLHMRFEIGFPGILRVGMGFGL